MKKTIIGLAILAALIIFVAYNVWRANEEPVTTPPSLVEIGRQQLHAQLQKSEAREAEIEKQDWDSIPLLRQLIAAHQHRIEQLSGNTQAGEIVAHDKDAIARLEKRIADLTAAAAAQPATPEAPNSGASAQAPQSHAPAAPSGVSPAHP
jgi:TolA-binding protein